MCSQSPGELGFEKDAYRNVAGDYSPDALTVAALKWMECEKNRPFFLYLPFHDVHAPFDPKPALPAKYKDRSGVRDPALAATVDANTGRLLGAVEKAGLSGRTYVIITPDNGSTRR